MSRFFKNPFRSAIVLTAVALLLLFSADVFFSDSIRTADEMVKEAEKRLSIREAEIISQLDLLRKMDSKELSDFFVNSSASTGFSFYIVHDSSIVLWSDNEPSANDSVIVQAQNQRLLKMSNGDFLSYTKQKGDSVLVGLILIRHMYDYQNKYLVNDFSRRLGLTGNFDLTDSGNLTFHLPGNAGEYRLKAHAPLNIATSPWTNLPNAIAIILLLLSVFLFLRHYSKSPFSIILFLLIVLLIRIVMIYFKLPATLYEQNVFDPSLYASSFLFNSLGDMLINAPLILVLTISFYEHAKPYRRMRLVLFFYWAIMAFIVHYLIRGLVLNSRLNFELSSPADLNIYCFIAYTSISLLLISFLFVTSAVWRNFRLYSINGRHAWIGITICSLYTAGVVSRLNTEKEHSTRRLLAEKAEARQDHVAEFLFTEQEKLIEKDGLVKTLIHSSGDPNEEVAAYLVTKYLSGYFSKFEITLQVFDEYAPIDTNINITYYRERAEQGRKTDSPDLYFINNESGGSSYLALIPVQEPTHRHTIVISLVPRLFRTTKGFPELLMSGMNPEVGPAEEYSIARYSSNTLVYQYGEYVYPLTGTQFISSKSEFVELNNYSHLIHFVNANSFIIVSKTATSSLGVLTLFSWMFIFMSIAAFALFVLAGIFTGSSAWKWNLSRKIQSAVIFLVVLIFVLVGTGTVNYIKSKYLSEQNKSISDQVNALWFLVHDNLSLNSDNHISAYQIAMLNRLVSNTNIDFNLYNRDGRIMYSSQPRIFNEGIISDKMNTMAFVKITSEGLTQFIHPEKAGKLRYIAAYAPFTDRSGKISAFLNLPYFEKQNELNKQVSVFLSAIVNIYVLLFALSVFVTIIISSRITKPLLLIQEKMSALRLGRLNQKIEYRPDDEIGKLVHEYNRMIDELEDSASKLARSERESAWREMARQVAHEIKNPLTPMKLSVQHLHRTLKDGTDIALVDRITETLIRQIDSLSNIATAFSNFAKMPQAVPSKVDVKDVIMQVKILYDEEGVIYLLADENEYMVHADKDQLTGVFSNLLKNSFQSIPEGRQGEIHIYLRREPGRIIAEIADNGIGIPEDQKDKIFIPNFTTKSSGMGLGLAIARNIVEEAKGSIWFTSTYGNGSSFFISLPQYS